MCSYCAADTRPWAIGFSSCGKLIEAGPNKSDFALNVNIDEGRITSLRNFGWLTK